MASTSKPRRDSKPARRRPWIPAIAVIAAIAVEFLIQVSASAATSAALSLAREGGLVDRATYASLAGSSFTFLVPCQLARILIMGCWYRARIGPRAVPSAAPRPRGAVEIALTVLFLVLFGVWFQFFFSLVLAVALPSVPDLDHAYSETVSSLEIAAPSVIAIVSSVAFAPIGEELLCRGVLLGYALDAFRRLDAASTRPPREARCILFANVAQAACFALLHLDPVQSAYAFVMGLALGWARVKTASLLYPVVLHAAINASAYMVAPCSARVPAGLIILAVSLAMCGVAWLRERAVGRGEDDPVRIES